MKKLEKIELTIHEWKDALKVPPPHRNKKKYFRKEKHKKLGGAKALPYIYRVRLIIKNQGYE